MKIHFFAFLAAAVLLAGCAHSSWETGRRDQDHRPDDYGMTDDRPASLVEVTFGGGEAEVTKNLPGDAAQSLEDAVKRRRGKQPADVTATTGD